MDLGTTPTPYLGRLLAQEAMATNDTHTLFIGLATLLQFPIDRMYRDLVQDTLLIA